MADMKVLGLLLVLGVAAAASVPNRHKRCVHKNISITKDSLRESFKKYTSEHDIVNMMVPLNDLTEESIDYEEGEINVTVSLLFFVQGDYKDDGTFENKGLYVLKTKTGEATKLLDNGVDFAAGKTKDVYFAATDGIYVYNAEKNTAEKYGSLTDNIINIVKPKDEDDVIYILTADKELYKVTEHGGKKVKVDNVNNAQHIVMNRKDNIYFYDDKNHISVLSENRVIKARGLPENPKKITLLRPFRYLADDIIAVIDDKAYLVMETGRTESAPFEIKDHPSAYSMEATFVQYYAYKKSIYEYNMMKDDLPESFLYLISFMVDHELPCMDDELAEASKNEIHAKLRRYNKHSQRVKNLLDCDLKIC